MHQPQSRTAQQYRRKAEQYGKLAGCARSSIDQNQLLRMRDACMVLAATQDRLDGVVPFVAANSNMLAGPGRHR